MRGPQRTPAASRAGGGRGYLGTAASLPPTESKTVPLTKYFFAFARVFPARKGLKWRKTAPRERRGGVNARTYRKPQQKRHNTSFRPTTSFARANPRRARKSRRTLLYCSPGSLCQGLLYDQIIRLSDFEQISRDGPEMANGVVRIPLQVSRCRATGRATTAMGNRQPWNTSPARGFPEGAHMTENLPVPAPRTPASFSYQSEDGRTRLEVRLTGDTVWLALNQMADLFKRDKSVISRHIPTSLMKGSYDAKELLQFLQQLPPTGKPTRSRARRGCRSPRSARWRPAA